jgi:hypothetical protein
MTSDGRRMLERFSLAANLDALADLHGELVGR